MNTIEKRKGQLKNLGLIVGIVAAVALLGGILMLALGGANPGLIITGVILTVLGVLGILAGVVFVWVSRAVVATKGSIAEENLGKGTVNMHKCSNCGAEIAPEQTICAKCEENLKP